MTYKIKWSWFWKNKNWHPISDIIQEIFHDAEDDERIFVPRSQNLEEEINTRRNQLQYI